MVAVLTEDPFLASMSGGLQLPVSSTTGHLKPLVLQDLIHMGIPHLHRPIIIHFTKNNKINIENRQNNFPICNSHIWPLVGKKTLVNKQNAIGFLVVLSVQQNQYYLIEMVPELQSYASPQRSIVGTMKAFEQRSELGDIWVYVSFLSSTSLNPIG